LKKVISKVIDVRQSTFLKRRGLLDSVLRANEVLEEMKERIAVVFSLRLIMRRLTTQPIESLFIIC